MELRVENIEIQGGTLRAGYHNAPHPTRATITILGDRSTPPVSVGREAQLLSGKSLIVGGNLTLFGRERSHSWTRLATTAAAGSSTLTVAADVNWQVGDRIVVASSSFDPHQAEERTITSVASGSAADTTVLGLDTALTHRHYAGSESHGTRSMDMMSEVALLSSNVVVQGEPSADQTGAQIAVLSYSRDAYDCSGEECVGGFVQDFVGAATLRDVEIRHCGQLGISGRPALLIDSGMYAGWSTFERTTIHKSYNTAIEVRRAQGFMLQDVAAFYTVGPAFFTSKRAEDTTIARCLGLVSFFPETYQDLRYVHAPVLQSGGWGTGRF